MRSSTPPLFRLPRLDGAKGLWFAIPDPGEVIFEQAQLSNDRLSEQVTVEIQYHCESISDALDDSSSRDPAGIHKVHRGTAWDGIG